MSPATQALLGLVAVHGVLAVLVSGHALLNKRDPRSAWAWTTASVLLPVGGVLLYWWFGINRIERRARRELGAAAPLAPETLADEVPDLPGANAEEVRELARLGRAVAGRRLRAGNRVEVLHNGEQAYPAMLDAIARARRQVWLASYIFDDGHVGRRFAHALAAASARGAQVRVLVDGVGDIAQGTRGSALLRRYGVEVHRFIPPRLFPPLLHINLRNHRKLLCVDGEVAFVGGINIGDHHLLLRGPDHSSQRGTTVDLHFEVEGPVVGQLGEAFADDWAAACGEFLAVPPAPAVAGPVACRTLTTGPNDELGRLQLLLLGALANAHHSVQVMTPYFIPTPELSSALEAAALRGVAVSLVLPQKSDHPWLDAAARRWLGWLLARGVRVFLRPPPFAHSKLFVVDGYYALVGSANLDPRSLRLNFELMLEAYDAALAGRLQQHFADVIPSCRELRPADLQARPLRARLHDAVCWLFSPYL